MNLFGFCKTLWGVNFHYWLFCCCYYPVCLLAHHHKSKVFQFVVFVWLKRTLYEWSCNNSDHHSAWVNRGFYEAHELLVLCIQCLHREWKKAMYILTLLALLPWWLLPTRKTSLERGSIIRNFLSLQVVARREPVLRIENSKSYFLFPLTLIYLFSDME